MRISPITCSLLLGGLLLTLPACDFVDVTSPAGLDAGPNNSTLLVEVCQLDDDGNYVKLRVAPRAAAVLLAGDGVEPGTGGLDADCNPSIDIVGETISAGGHHSCGLDASGNAYCWGWNSAGQLGNGSTASSNTPVAVSMPAKVRFASISAGAQHTVALTSTGAAYAWGFNERGQLGDGTYTNSNEPVAVSGGITFKL
jgi:hypothetical protein